MRTDLSVEGRMTQYSPLRGPRCPRCEADHGRTICSYASVQIASTIPLLFNFFDVGASAGDVRWHVLSHGGIWCGCAKNDALAPVPTGKASKGGQHRLINESNLCSN